MRRAFEIDVLACPRCGGRLRLMATVEDPGAIRTVLGARVAGPSASVCHGAGRQPGDCHQGLSAIRAPWPAEASSLRPVQVPHSGEQAPDASGPLDRSVVRAVLAVG
jgi:hypothetical protein